MSEFSPVMQKIIDAVDNASGKIIEISHTIHDNPEISDQEFQAAALLEKTLEEFGFEVEREFAGHPTAFRGVKKGKGPGAKVAFLCEYDALVGIGHGCGHNVIASTGLAAGIGLGAVMDELPGELWVVGTPSEEVNGYKVEMVKQGIFKEVDAALMVHGDKANYKCTKSLAVTPIGLIFHGKAAHASAEPWAGVNALDAMQLLFAGLNAMRQQVRPDARIHGFIAEGGYAPNIIPDRTSGRFNVRAGDRAYCDELHERFMNVVKGACLMTGAEFEEYYYAPKYDQMNNNETLAFRAADYAEMLGAEKYKYEPDSFGSIDMGDVSNQCPAIHMLIDLTGGKNIAVHTKEFSECARSPLADEQIIRAGKALALTGYDVLSDEKYRAKVKEEFVNSLK